MPFFEIATGMLGHGCQHKAQKVLHIELALHIGPIVAIVGLAQFGTINDAQGAQKIQPGMVGIAGQQGVVEIENGQGHVYLISG